MAMAKRFKVSHDEVFPFGAFLIGEVVQVVDFDRSTRETKYQQIDKDSGLPLWQIDVVDADPEAKRSAKTLSIKFPAKVQPVPPANESGSPFTPVVFEGMTALPYVESVTEDFSRIAWSFRAEGMRGLKAPSQPSASSGASGAGSAAGSPSKVVA